MVGFLWKSLVGKMNFCILALVGALIFSSVSAGFRPGSRQAAQAAAMVLSDGQMYGSPYGMNGPYGGGMSSRPGRLVMGGSSMASSMESGMMSVSATAVSMGAIQTRWNNAQSFCNDAMSRVAHFIAKIEETVLGLPLTVIKAMMGIPIRITEIALDMARSILPLLHRAKGLLGDFFRSVFELPAKALYGSISILMDLINKILDWGQSCHGQNVCQIPPPNIGGYGPCGGRWPCTRVVGCQSSSCFSTARALGGTKEAELDL